MNNFNVSLTGLLSLSFASGLPEVYGESVQSGIKDKRPNILFAISDDQSYPYASSYGNNGVQTPAFDELAKKGILFTNAFVAVLPSEVVRVTSTSCSPSSI